MTGKPVFKMTGPPPLVYTSLVVFSGTGALISSGFGYTFCSNRWDIEVLGRGKRERTTSELQLEFISNPCVNFIYNGKDLVIALTPKVRIGGEWTKIPG